MTSNPQPPPPRPDTIDIEGETGSLDLVPGPPDPDPLVNSMGVRRTIPLRATPEGTLYQPPEPPRNPVATAMTMLDLFAAHAMSGMVAAGANGMYASPDERTALAGRAYAVARAMLRAREEHMPLSPPTR